LIATRPLQQGLAELVAYLQLGSASFRTTLDETATEQITWEALASVRKQASLPRIIFVR